MATTASSPNPETTGKVAVVGAGVTGIATALFLKNAGFDVTVYEARSEPGTAGTSVTSGVVTPYVTPYNTPHLINTIKMWACPWPYLTGKFPADSVNLSDILVPFGIRPFQFMFSEKYAKNLTNLVTLSTANHSLLLETVRDLKLDVPIGWGQLRLMSNGIGKDIDKRNTNYFKKIVPDCDIKQLESTDAMMLFPALRGIKAEKDDAFLTPSAAIVDPVHLTKQLAKKAEQSGINIKYNCRVEALETDATGTRVSRIHTNEQDNIPIDKLVLCAGMGTAPLASTLTKQSNLLIPVLPVKSLSFTVQDITVPPDNNNKSSTTNSNTNNNNKNNKNNNNPSTTTPPATPTNPNTTPTSPPLPVPALFPSQPHVYMDVSTREPLFLQHKSSTLFASAIKSALDRLPSPFPGALEFVRENTTIFPIATDNDAERATAALADQSAKQKRQMISDVEMLRKIHSNQPSSLRDVMPSVTDMVDSKDYKSFEYPHETTSLSPGRFKVVVGADTANINAELPQNHVDSALHVTNLLRAIPSFLTKPIKDRFSEISAENELKEAINKGDSSAILAAKEKIQRLQLKKAEKIGGKDIVIDRDVNGFRHLVVDDPHIACHTVSRDGLPLIGKAHKFENLFMNVGHGLQPLSTAVAGAQVCAAVVAGHVPSSHDDDKNSKDNNKNNNNNNNLGKEKTNINDTNVNSTSNITDVRTRGILGLPLYPVVPNPDAFDPRRLNIRIHKAAHTEDGWVDKTIKWMGEYTPGLLPRAYWHKSPHMREYLEKEIVKEQEKQALLEKERERERAVHDQQRTKEA